MIITPRLGLMSLKIGKIRILKCSNLTKPTWNTYLKNFVNLFIPYILMFSKIVLIVFINFSKNSLFFSKFYKFSKISTCFRILSIFYIVFIFLNFTIFSKILIKILIETLQKFYNKFKILTVCLASPI